MKIFISMLYSGQCSPPPFEGGRKENILTCKKPEKNIPFVRSLQGRMFCDTFSSPKTNSMPPKAPAKNVLH